MPIPGTTKIAHVDENIAALDLKLTAEELKRLDERYAALIIEGASSGPSQLAQIDVGAKEGTSSAGGYGLSPRPGA